MIKIPLAFVLKELFKHNKYVDSSMVEKACKRIRQKLPVETDISHSILDVDIAVNSSRSLEYSNGMLIHDYTIINNDPEGRYDPKGFYIINKHHEPVSRKIKKVVTSVIASTDLSDIRYSKI